jgi:hypothetical protein
MSDPLTEVLRTLRNNPFSDHARCVGMVTILWSRLELQADALLAALMGLVDSAVTVGTIATLDFRQKLSLCKYLGFEKKISPEWYAELEAICNEIDNDIRPDRNRCVHDYWLASENNVVQLTVQIKIFRSQARKIASQAYKARQVTIAELNALQVRLLAATGKIGLLTSRYYSHVKVTSPSSLPDWFYSDQEP